VSVPAKNDGFLVVVQEECPTCQLVRPVLDEIADVTVVWEDESLDTSLAYEIETVPTLLKIESGEVVERTVGWSRDMWRKITGIATLGEGLPEHRPGCGSKTLEIALPVDTSDLRSRRVQIGSLEDDIEACIARGWSDGLPVVPPTPERVARMLEGPSRDAQDVVADVPPDLAPCTVEKVAINAVLAGCEPSYLPVVLAAVEAACTDEFNMHGLLATTYFSGPVVVVNGSITKRIGMNSGVNALGQGNRANSSIGRALQLVIRNVGGGRPGGVDRATLGNPGKLSFCFAEDEDSSPWESLASERGVEGDAVTLFCGEGPRAVVDQISRSPESLAKSFAVCLRTVAHPKLVIGFDAMLIVSPEHAARFREAAWSKQRLREEIYANLNIHGSELVRGAGGIEEGLPEGFKDATLPKFTPDGLLIVHAGGKAGLFSAVVGGWVAGDSGSKPVTRAIDD
jgi:hypothetical protein